MTDHDDPAASVRAFLAVWLAPGRDAIERIHADRAYELRGSDIAAVLQQLDAMRAERDQWRRDFFKASVDRSEVMQTAAERDEAMSASVRLMYERDDAEAVVAQLATQWGVRWPEGEVTEFSGEDVARRYAAEEPDVKVVRRLVGPWRNTAADGRGET